MTDENEADSLEVEGRPVEVVRQRDTQGRVNLLRQVAQDTDGNYINHGIWKQWDQDGHLIAVGEYRDGLRQGHWERILFAEETALLRQTPYREFEGPFLSEATFEKDKLAGKWVITDVQDRKVSEIEFADGQRKGTATWWYPNGQRYQEIQYNEGALDGDLVRWSPTGQEVSRKTFRQGREVVAPIEKFANGQAKAQITYMSPVLTLSQTDDWWEARFATYTVQGIKVKHGRAIEWHPNGQIARQGEFEDDVPVGKHTWWHANGQKAIEGEFRSGKSNGLWSWWHPNGHKATHGEYIEGVPVGQWSWWDAEGRMTQRAALDSAKPVTSNRRENPSSTTRPTPPTPNLPSRLR